MKKKIDGTEKLLTEVELELMTILWKIGEGSVADVMEQMPKERELAYTSISTILRILEQKDVLQTRKEGRGHVYIPFLKKAEYESKTLQRVVDRVFEGTPVALVKQLLDTVHMDEKDLAEIKKLIQQAGQKK